MSALRAVSPPDVRVLVVDDDRDLSGALCDVLSDAGYQVSSAVNGREALRVLAHAEPLPDLILVDLMMPVMDGYDFRQAQLADPRIAGIPTIALSAGPMGARLQAMRLAAWLPKPVSMDTLLGAVERHRLRRPDEAIDLNTPGGHSMQFYDTDGQLAADVAGFLAPALQAGGAAVVIATAEHWQKCEQELTQAGCDPAAARANGGLQVLDADETLQRILRHGRLSERRLLEMVEPVLAGAERVGSRVRAYGEMVDLLWRAGDIATAVSLEQFWNRLLPTARCDLHCSYAAPTTAAQSAAVDWVLQQHVDSMAV